MERQFKNHLQCFISTLLMKDETSTLLFPLVLLWLMCVCCNVGILSLWSMKCSSKAGHTIHPSIRLSPKEVTSPSAGQRWERKADSPRQCPVLSFLFYHFSSSKIQIAKQCTLFTNNNTKAKADLGCSVHCSNQLLK